MSPDDYWAVIRGCGLIPERPTADGTAIICRDRRNMDPVRVPKPEELSAEERRDFVDFLKWRLGISTH